MSRLTSPASAALSACGVLRRLQARLLRERARAAQLEAELAASERRRKEIQTLARIGDWEYDLVNDQIRWSEETFLIFGLKPGSQEPDFADILLSIHPDDVRAFDRAVQQAIAAGRSYKLDLRIRCPNGRQKHIHAQGSPIYNRGQVERIIGTVLDITERKTAEERLCQEASYDALTGLMNRRSGLAALEEAVRQAEESRAPLSACVCDLDQFKAINDTYGHGAGDEVLVAFSARLREGTRTSDTPARLGGDEFLIVFPGATPDQAAVCTERIRKRFEEDRFQSAAGTYGATATFGVAPWRPGVSAGELLGLADRGLYQGKQRGRNCTAVQDNAPLPAGCAVSGGYQARAQASTRGSAPALSTPVSGSTVMAAFDPSDHSP